MAIGNSNNTIKTRVQLKSDTEANWRKAVLVADGGTKTSGNSFVPLAGELIIYMPDTTHDYSRLKVGDGSTNVLSLPFIDSGTVNGEVIVNEIVHFSGTKPTNGDSTKLYVDNTNNAIFYYDGTNWQKLSNYTYTFSKDTATMITNWNAGSITQMSLSGGTFFITHGTVPTLSKENKQFLSNAVKEGES